MYATIIKLNTLRNYSASSTVISRGSWRKTRLKASDVHPSLPNSIKEATGQNIGKDLKTNMVIKDEGLEGHENGVGEIRIMERQETVPKPDGNESSHHTIKDNSEIEGHKVSTSTAVTITPSSTPSIVPELPTGGSNHSSVDPVPYSDKSSSETPFYSQSHDNPDKSPAQTNPVIAVCMSILGVAVILVIIFFAYRFWKERKEQGKDEGEETKKRHISYTPMITNRKSRFSRSNSSDTESGIRQCAWQENRETEKSGGSFADRMSISISKRFNRRISIFSTIEDTEPPSQISPVVEPQDPESYDWAQLVTLNTPNMGVHPGTLVSVPITSPTLDKSFDHNFGYPETNRSTPEVNDKHTTWPERRRGDGPDGMTIPPPGSSSPYSSTYSTAHSPQPSIFATKSSTSRPLSHIQKLKSPTPKSTSKGKGKSKSKSKSPTPSTNLTLSAPPKPKNNTTNPPISPISQIPILEQDVFDSLPYHYDSSPSDEVITPAMKAAYDDTASVYSVASSIASVNSYLMPGLSPAPSQSSVTVTKSPPSLKSSPSSPITVEDTGDLIAKSVPLIITPPTPPIPATRILSLEMTEMEEMMEMEEMALTPRPVISSTRPRVSTCTSCISPPLPPLSSIPPPPQLPQLPPLPSPPRISSLASLASLPPLIPPSEFPPSPTSPPPSTELPALPLGLFIGLPGLSAVKRAGVGVGVGMGVEMGREMEKGDSKAGDREV